MTSISAPLAGLFAALLWTGAAHSADFTPCADAGALPALRGSLCVTETVPLSYADTAAGERLSLFVRKFPAPAPGKGAVWVVAGGPGESGASLYPFVDRLRRGFPGYDLLIPDHRGTGYSSRLCPAEEAPGSAGGTALAGAEWASCFGQLAAGAARARQFSITNAAHDLRQLVMRHHDGKPVYVYAVSYGTQLVLRAMQMGELPVAGLVLDSLMPPETAAQWDLSRRSLVVDDVGGKVLAQCDADPRCGAVLGEPAAAAYRRVLAAAAQRPELVAAVPGGSLPRFMGRLLDVPALRARIPYLIRDLDRGRGDELAAVRAGLSAAGAALGAYPQSPPSIPLVAIISGSENNLRPDLTAAELKQEEAPLLFSSPLPGLLLQRTLPLYARDSHFGAQPARLPPTLVLSGTLDPKTHYDGTAEHVAALRRAGPIRFVRVTGAPHFIVWVAPDCFERHASAFVAGAPSAAADIACAPASAPVQPEAPASGESAVRRSPPASPARRH